MDWSARVKAWAEERNLIDGSTPERQLVKLQEEMDELTEAIEQGDVEGAVDAIGDTAVVLRIIAAQLEVPWYACLESAWIEIKDRKGKMVDGLFVKETAAEAKAEE